jgi:signal peptidase I
MSKRNQATKKSSSWFVTILLLLSFTVLTAFLLEIESGSMRE